MIHQPRTPTGNFDSNGATPHEKHRFHSHAAHICRVNALIAGYNAETSHAETQAAAAIVHERIAAAACGRSQTLRSIPMARGDIHWFGQAVFDLGKKLHDLSSDVLKLAIVTGATVPSLTTADPHFGGTGATNFATNQVAVAGTSYTGPITLSGKTWAYVAGVSKLRFDIVNLPLDASGFTNGEYGIIYNSTDANKRALGWVELANVSLATAPLAIDWNGVSNDSLTLTPA